VTDTSPAPDAVHQFRLAAKIETQTELGLGGAPYHIGQVSSVAGLDDIPPTITLGEGEFAREARIGVNFWDVQPYDTVCWLPTDGLPLVIARLPMSGSPSLLAEDADDNEPDPWHYVGTADEPAYASGWTTYTGVPAYADPAFRKQSDGWVALKGLADRTSGSGASTVFTLPEGYRPEDTYYFTVPSGSGASDAFAQVWVEPDGDVVYASNGDPTAFLGFDDVFFPTKVNPAAYIHPVLEDNWSGFATGVASEAIRAYLRSDGWCWWTGVMRTATATAGIRAIMRIDSRLANNPLGKVQVMLSSSNNLARFDFGGSSDAGDRSPCRVIFANSGIVTAVVLGGRNYFSNAGANINWTNLSYLNGWATNAGDLAVPAAYYLDHHGMVHLQGLVTGSGSTATTICQLPVGFRPMEDRVFISNDATSPGRVDVRANGDVVSFYARTSYRTLTGIKFHAEQ
jgi:hypothetical protein